MSIAIINLANREFRISYKSQNKEKLLRLAKSLDNKIKEFLEKSPLTSFELLLVITSLKLEENIEVLTRENDRLMNLLQDNMTQNKKLKEKLLNIAERT